MPLSRWTCHHQSTPSAVLKTGSENNEETNESFKCGECHGHFSTICILHSHLKGGSYRYDSESMTAFPLHGATCSNDEELENEPEPSPNADAVEITSENNEESSPIADDLETISEEKHEESFPDADDLETTSEETHEEPFQNYIVEMETVSEVKNEMRPEDELNEQENRRANELDEQESRPEIELNKPSEKYYKVYTARSRLKRKRTDEPTINVLKIVDEPYIKVEESSNALHSNLSGLVGKHVVYEGVVEANIVPDMEPNANKFDYSENDSVIIKSEANMQYIEHLDQYSKDCAEVHVEQVVETDVTNIQDEHTEDTISGAENVKFERHNDTQTVESVETEQEDKLDDSISCNIKLPALYKALISTSTGSHSHVDSLGINSSDTRKETLLSSAAGSNNPLSVESQGMENDFGTRIQTVIVDNVADSTVLDKDLEQTVAAFGKLGEPQSRYKQVVVTLHGMETDADGSVQIVVGEEDAAIFNTDIGDEILKALRLQAKEIPAHEKTQIVFNYLDPQDQEPNFIKYGDLSEQSVSIINEDRPHISYIRAPKRPRRFDHDDSLPKFRIPLPRAEVQADLVMDLNSAVDALNHVELKPVVFKILNEKLNWQDALNIINECNSGQHSDLISKTQPVLARGGELYVVDLEALPHRKDCRYDKYLWMNCVTRKYPKKNPIMNKHVFKIRLPNSQFSDAFQRHIYQFIEASARYCVIHYIGHESVFQPLAHGNSKTGAVFNRTCPSVLKELRDLSKEDGMTANKLHKQIESLTVPSHIRGFRTPRNLGQIKNTFKYARRKNVNQE